MVCQQPFTPISRVPNAMPSGARNSVVLRLACAAGLTMVMATLPALGQGAAKPARLPPSMGELEDSLEKHFEHGSIAYSCSPFLPVSQGNNPELVKHVAIANGRGDYAFQCRPFVKPGKEDVAKLSAKDGEFVAFISRMGEIRKLTVPL